MKGDFRRYLAAKETVDARAFSREVLRRVRSDLADRSGRVRLLDAGTGTGPFLRRLLAWSDCPDLTYVAVDTDRANLALARERTARAARDRGYSVVSNVSDASDASDAPPVADAPGGVGGADGPGRTVGSLSLRGANAVDVRFVRGDALDAADAGGWTFVVAQAFVDLLDPAGVDRLLDGLVPGGRFYFPITFDGGTAFEPPHDADDAVLSAYHETMHRTDDSDSPGRGDRLGSRAGRRLERRLDARGVDYLAADADWAVRPLDGGGGSRGDSVAGGDSGGDGDSSSGGNGDSNDSDGDGTYPADEAYFLRVVVETVADAVRGRVGAARREAWLTARLEQLDAGRLRYRARNRDVTGRVE